MALRLKSSDTKAGDEVTDRRLQWLEWRISAALKLKPAEMKKLMDNDENRMSFLEFLDVPDRKNVFVIGTTSAAAPYAVLSGEYEHHRRFTYDLRRKVMYFTKLKKEKLLDEKVFGEKIIFGDCSVDVLQSLHDLSKHVVLPLMQKPVNLRNVADVRCGELIHQTHALLAQNLVTLGKAHFRTLLPLPPISLPASLGPAADAVIDKELAHELERSIVEWSAAIRTAIVTTPEDTEMLMLQSNKHVTDAAAADGSAVSSKPAPTPFDEIDFWDDKQKNLQQLEEQLSQPFVLKAMVILQRAGSPYHGQFTALWAELHEALLEAAECARFLRPLRPILNAINVNAADKLPLDQLGPQATFRTIFQLLLALWSDCRAFATAPRMVHFIASICNALMTYVLDAMDGVDVFTNEPEEVMRHITDILNICGDFKAAFFEAKAKAAKDFPRPWKFQNTALFKRLDALLERLHDLLDTIETTLLFTKALNIRVGTAEGIALSTQIDRIYEKYVEAVGLLQRVPLERLYDVDHNDFDRAYETYRKDVTLLESALMQIVGRACADTSSVPNLFKIIDSFDGFHERTVGRQDWAERQPSIVDMWHKELMQVQEHLRDGAAEAQCAAFFPNVPPTSAVLMWCQGLLARLNAVQGRMMELDHVTLTGTRGRECRILHDQLVKEVQQLISNTYDAWATQAGQLSADKLRSTLLSHDEKTNTFRVNFDPFLASTLKEAVLLEAKAEEDDAFALPQQVMALSRNRETLRRQVLRLTHICTTINTINHKLRPSELPLVQDEAKVTTEYLMKAVRELQWCSADLVEDFVEDGLRQVGLLERAMSILHTSLEDCKKMISDFAAEDKFLPLIPTRADVRVMLESEFRKKISEYGQARRERMREIGGHVSSRLETIFADLNEVKLSAGVQSLGKTDARWSNYADYFSSVVCDALCKCALHSLKGLTQQLDVQYVQQINGIPLFDVKLTLSRPPTNANLHAGPNTAKIVFDPPLLTTDRQIEEAIRHERETAVNNGNGKGGNKGSQSPPTAGGFVPVTGGAAGAAIVSSSSQQHQHDSDAYIRHQQLMMDQYVGGKLPQTSIEGALEQYLGHIMDIADEVPCADNLLGSETYRRRVESDPEIMAAVNTIRDIISETVHQADTQLAPFVEFSYLFQDNIAAAFNQFVESKAREEAERPHDIVLAGGPRVVPYYSGVPIEAYEGMIRQFEELHDVLGDLPMSRSSGFLKIDTKPLRTTLLELCSRWRDAYAGHIASKTLKELQSLYSFIETAEGELKADVVDGDLDTLKRAMRCIRDCRRRNEVVVSMLVPMGNAIAMLKRHPTSVRAAMLEQVEELRKPALESWNTLFRRCLNTREQYSSAQDREAQHIKSETLTFENKISATAAEMRQSRLYVYELPARPYSLIDEWSRRIDQLDVEAKALLDLQELFELSPSEFREMRECRQELVSLKQLWDVVCHVQTLFQEWMTSQFAVVDVDGFLDEIRILQKQLKAQPMKCKEWLVFKGLQEAVQNMAKSLPLCAELRTPAMRDRHWKMLLQSAHQGGHIDPHADDFTLQSLINLGIHQHAEEVNNIVEKAQKELVIEKALLKIEDVWTRMTVGFEENKDLGTMMLGAIDAIVEQLEADSNTLQSMMANRFVEYFLARVQLWQRNLGTVDTCLVKLAEIQRKWQNLFPIFVLSADIREQLPNDAMRFRTADDLFRQLMQAAYTKTNVIELLCTDAVISSIPVQVPFKDLEEYLVAVEEILVACEKALSEYLETKRKIFPRFYFVSSADLVDILSKGSDPRAVMVHMSKVIDSIETFIFSADYDPSSCNFGSAASGRLSPTQGGSSGGGAGGDSVPLSGHPKAIRAMESVQGEIVPLSQEYICEGAVESWLAGCIDAMQKAMRMHISEAIAGYADRPRTEWIYHHPCQAIIVGSRSYFTSETQSAFQMMEEGNEGAMREYLKTQKLQLDTLIREALTPQNDNVRKMLVHLITIDVHNRDIIQGLVDDKIDAVDAFAWQSQLRYYWDEARGSEVRICDAEFLNGYEYVGLCGCLVITKLTDRCYITLSQALRLKRGGAPAGPAGTGKTETTKDLARNLGIACYVFNCSDQMNYVTLGQVFKGLAMSGSWGCFDEFNRISIDVLSVVATQVNSILNALKGQRHRFRFMDEEISLIPRVGIFITMNPGYAGRTELPENIKSLFRPCAMVVPDLKNICEIMLAAEGFSDAKDLALKFVTLYRLNKELLSPQDHYDWGLRAVKSVLYIAGSLKRGDPDVPERRVLMRALRDTNLAKLSKDDVYVFMGLIRSLFPQLEVPKKNKTDLYDALKQQCKSMGNFPGDNDIFLLKCAQYEEILHVRHSVFILGAAGCGKTQMWKCLQGALARLGDKAVSSALNPKAITSNELYGYIHPQTKEWHDGVLSNIFRQYALESKTRKNSKWIVLDGIVDAEWIESMNTVMDDNKMLTLVSNERIPLTESMRMIFEVSQLRNASPATVSRGGVIFINESDLGWVPFRDKWLATRDSREATTIETLFDRYVPPAFEYFRRSLKTVVPVMDIAIVQTICFLLEGLLKALPAELRSSEVYERYFAFALVWAFGGPLPSDGRIDYRYHFSTWWRKENPHLKMSDAGTVFDFFVDAGDKFEFKPWSELVQPYMPDSELPLASVSVQTADTVRMNTLISYLVDSGKSVMLVGTAGTGKSNIMMTKLRALDNNETIYRVIAFNARTNATSLQAVMDQNLEKRTGRVFGPPQRRKLIFFLDDMNMPAPDKYGTQEAIALLQQHVNYGFWFDRSKMIPREIHDVRYVGAMNPKSGTFTILDRLLRHYAVFSTNMPDRNDLSRIYGQILSAHLAHFQHSVSHLAEAMTKATIELHSQVLKTFLPTAVLFHYQWNMRELFNVFQGLCAANPKLHKDGHQVVRLWAHECQRTFRDRMPIESDMRKFDELLFQVQRDFFSEIPQEKLEPEGLWAPLRTTREGDENVYDECDAAFTEKILTSRLADYNSNVATMDLVLFEQAIEHVCRISRILANPRGNALLVGVGGSGKQSLSKLASYILSLEVAQILVTSTYGIANFRTDMQEIYKRCGLKGIPHTFIITDQQVVVAEMLVYLNDMLSSGNVPDLFVGDERDAVVQSIMSEVKQSGHSDYSNPDVCWDFFINKVRTNMHIVLCLSPISPKFAVWCRQFPAISNTTVIDWFHAWPAEALRSVSHRFLANEHLGDADTKAEISDFIADSHDMITKMSDEYFAAEKRRCYTTPKSFLETIQLYKDLLRKNREKVDRQSKRLVAGIDKIREAAAQVAGLQEVLVQESAEVEEARQKTEKLMEFVGREKGIVEEQRALAAVEEQKTNKIVVEVEAFASECEKDLAAARPLVEEARAALNTLDKASLTELKSMARPPDDVVMVCAAVKVLTSDPNRIPNVKNRDWANCKLMMGNVTNWMKDLLAFDQENIPQSCIDALQIYVTSPSFEPASVITKSLAAAGLCKWVRGMNAYHAVRCQVRPKEQRLAEAQERLTTSRAQLKRVQDKVSDLQSKLDVLVAQFDDANNTAKQIEAKARKTRLKMELAERLVNGLSGEKTRWGKTIEELKGRAALLIGDVLLAAAFTSYIGPFTKDFRSRVVDELWRPAMRRQQIPMTADLDPVLGLLATEADVARWCNEGLQSDPVSVQNGAIVMNCSRWPLLIDPQLQGVKWIKTQFEKEGLVIMQPGQKRWLERLVDCIEQGVPCLIEGCSESIDPVLDNVLSRTTFRRGNKLLMRVGGLEAEYNNKFRLFLQTRLSNPSFSPEINAQTTLINFMVTESGLEDQLLAVVVTHDRKDLEEKRAALIRNMNSMTIELQQCEDGLLMELSNATGDILENVALVENLEATKKKATDISHSMQQAIVTQAKITESRALYKKCAARGSLIFFQIDRLCKIDHMYQYSLEAFMGVFNKALVGAAMPEDRANIPQRVENVSRSITESVYAYVANGMFERHKLILSSMITFAILLRSGEIDRKQLDFLLQGKKKTTGEARPETVREWCTDATWCSILALADVEGTTPPFSHLPQDMSESNRWRVWQDAERPEEEKMPTDWKNLTPFQRLLVLRCLRPDRLTTALEAFVAATIGKFFISDQATDLSVTYKGSSPISPIFFILSPGVDPVRNVEALGAKCGFTYDNGRLFNVSLGQGQEVVAERALKTCFSNGGWCMLNNVHLVEKWMREFEKLMEQYTDVYTRMAAIEREKAARRAGRRLAWRKERLAQQREQQQQGDGNTSAEHQDDDGGASMGQTSPQDGALSVGGAVDDDQIFEDEPDFAAEEDDADLDDPSLEKGSLEFRIFLSAEPSEAIPISVLQRSIKLTSEPPTGIKQNVARALRSFSDEPWERSTKPTEFRAVTFAMCFFHAVVVERKKFGPQGWNRVYPFNIGDLTTCIDVLGNYIEDRSKIPWEDLRYVFGEIMYGGHITDDWDRVLCMAYLGQWVVPDVTDGLELAGGFCVPAPMSFAEYETYIEEQCPEENPVLYGLHQNAEINYRTAQAQSLLGSIADLQPKTVGSTGAPGKRKSIVAGEVETPNDIVRAIVDDLTEKLPESFNLLDISERLDEDRTPVQHVFYQECERMNILLDVARRSLLQMTLSLKGELSMTDEIQEVFNELLLGRVPQSWLRVSFASVRPLATWFENLLQRYNQCNDWTAELTSPKVILLNLFFNPMSLLTALMQATSIANNYDLDQMGLLAEVTKRVPDQIDVPARDGAFIYGFAMEGARWDTGSGSIEDSRIKELYPRLPVITIRALPLTKLDRRDQYECPVYKTQTRGPTFVVGLHLRSKAPARRWTIAGVGLLLDVSE